MSRSVPPIRTIKHESIRLGDVVRISGRIGDMEVARVGTVAKRTHSSIGTEYTTPSGMVLLTVYRDGSTDFVKLRIALLNEGHLYTEPVDEALFDMEDAG